MECTEARDRLSEIIDATQAAPVADALTHHVAGCRGCAAELAALKAVSHMMLALPLPEGSPDLSRRTLERMRRIERDAPETPERTPPTSLSVLAWLAIPVRIPAFALTALVLALAVTADRWLAGWPTGKPPTMAPASQRPGDQVAVLPAAIEGNGGPTGADDGLDLTAGPGTAGLSHATLASIPEARPLDFSARAIAMVETPQGPTTLALAITHDRAGRSRVEVLPEGKGFFLVQGDVIEHFFMEDDAWMSADYSGDTDGESRGRGDGGGGGSGRSGGGGGDGGGHASGGDQLPAQTRFAAANGRTRIIGVDHVAGREVVVVDAPPGADAKGQTIRRWIDRATGLLLRSEARDATGHLTGLLEILELAEGGAPGQGAVPIDARPRASHYLEPPGGESGGDPRAQVVRWLHRLSVL